MCPTRTGRAHERFILIENVVYADVDFPQLVAKDLLAHEQVAEQIAVVVIVRETQILDIRSAAREGESPAEDELERQLKELCSNLELQTDKEFRHCIITIKRSGYNVQELKAYIFNSALELVEEENWSQYLKPSYTFLDDTKKYNEVDIIKPTLKKDFLVQDKDTMPEIKNDKNDEKDVNEEE